MKKISNRLLFIFTASVLFMNLISCVSTKHDDVHSTEKTEKDQEFFDIEDTVCQMDEAYLLFQDNSENINPFTEYHYKNLRNKIDQHLSQPSLTKNAQAKLISMKGRIFIFEGKKTKAKECYDLASSLSKSQIQTIILKNRLGLTDNLDEEKIFSEDKGLLQLEKGLLEFSRKEYMKAVTNIDSAFLSLDSSYRFHYENLRKNAWNFRNLTTGDSLNSLLSKNMITVGQVLLLTQEYSEHLSKLNSTRKYTEDELFKKVNYKEMLSPVSGSASFSVQKNDYVTKIICARFLWNLYNYNHNNTDINVYSEKYRKKNRSPVKDLELNSCDFDAAIGCIEHEFMNLKDGVNFGINDYVSGLEFKSYLNNLK